MFKGESGVYDGVPAESVAAISAVADEIVGQIKVDQAMRPPHDVAGNDRYTPPCPDCGAVQPIECADEHVCPD